MRGVDSSLARVRRGRTDAALRSDKLDFMRLWVSRNSEVSVREQLSTQIVLAISSKVLEPGEKLPSTRSLARRLGIHANTVSAAFRDLASRGWVEVQKGSGVFVRAFEDETPLEGDLELDRLVRQFIERAREEGFSLLEIRSRVAHWLESHPPDHYLLIEADPELRRILQHEISSKTGVRVEAVGLDDCRDPSALVGAAVVALYGKGAAIRSALPPGYPCLWLRSRSVQDELSKSLRPLPEGVHLAVVSRWPDFINWARTILLAAGLDPDVLSFHDARVGESFEHRHDSCRRFAALVAVESRRTRPAAIRLLPDSSLDELREHARQSFSKAERKRRAHRSKEATPISRRT